MSQSHPAPEQERIADAVTDHWVDTRAPAWARPYLRLSRWDRPIGVWLLLFPCWWGLALGLLWDDSPRWEDLWIAIACLLGAGLMRGAGCTWNDITDRHIDGQVARTARRPLPSGAVSLRQALIWMVAQAVLAFAVLLTLNGVAIALGIAALVPVAIYPFAKRFTSWPQAFLGVAFNWGALLGFAAHTGHLGWPAVALWGAGIMWTLFYDTIYAHQDVEDDALIGVKSTARLFGDHTPDWLRRFMVAAVCLMALAVVLVGPQMNVLAVVVALGAPWVLGWHLTWQLTRFDPENGPGLLRLFRSNRDAGFFPLIFLALAAML